MEEGCGCSEIISFNTQYTEGPDEKRTILMMFVSVACLDYVWTVFSCTYSVWMFPRRAEELKKNVLLRSSMLIILAK